ncbi:MAG TPA: SAM-dependent methyltransferase [Bacteroidales bacterium]|nr:SAM-dependent methyltransferase [Bacteroidales bacterium]HNZ41831.1 SAM-dependent methyltransferase [Bacteroidales bacterium]HOH83992.1 SAM-dependent methyltransferase [Bacteroidales bacterium]HPB24594.1 SAM-dependent methyltransferase [Bacteroidales bacterium]HPI29520.1 SAM-dependent methyltransferase [Bacteroidales bacterium]
MPETNNSASSKRPKGKLYLLPSLLGETSEMSAVLPENTIKITSTLTVFIVEELRTARRFLKKIDKNINIDSLEFLVFNEHSIKENISQYIAPMLQGKHAGILSEAGLPCIADPGSEIVAEAHRQNIDVVPLTGPSSIILALIASGFNGQNFAFHGYLPVDKALRAKKLRQLEMDAVKNNQTQIFIETPYRNLQIIQSISETCHSETMLCVAADLTLPSQKILSKPVSFWKKHHLDIHKRPAVFLLFAP